MSEPTPAPGAARFPPQVKYIVGNEAAERYSYYGMTAILTLFMANALGMGEDRAETIYHLFVAAVYGMTLLGAFISDRYWGKYTTIVVFSLAYVAGHGVLAIWESEAGLYAGLGLIALGAGGIKPCVATHMGDQFTGESKSLLDRAFPIFYFSINIGSFLATLLTPYTREWFGHQVAFGVPGVLMAIALVVFVLGHKHYVVVDPVRRDDTPGRVLWYWLRRDRSASIDRYGERAVLEAATVLRVAVVMLPCLMFWALFLQTGSSWVLLSAKLDLHGWLQPDSLASANPALVMLMIPLFTLWIYPAAQRRGRDVTSLAKMTLGMFVTAAAFVPVALLQWLVEAGHQPSALWMLIPYVILTAGEILVSITAMEFAYAEAPVAAKSTIMGLWYVTIGSGSFLKVVVGWLAIEGAVRFALWAGLMAVTALVFAILARRYRSASLLAGLPEAKASAA